MADDDRLIIPGRGNDVAGKRHYSTYYSGTDIRIYFGDYWVDEIVEIEFAMQEQVAPIYGYASYVYDKVARGSRIITGSFSINFKEVGYLQTILDRLSSKQSGESATFFNLQEFNEGQKSPDGTIIQNAHKDTSVEYIIDNFMDLAEDYENALWGMESGFTNKVKSRSKDTFFYNTRDNPTNQVLRDKGFNILITFGQAPDPSRGTNNFYNYKTAQTLIGVQLTGIQTRVDPSGNPVQEVYSFIAKDLSGNLQEYNVTPST